MEKNKSVKRMDWRQKVLISILGSFIVILSILFCITYHYFVKKIETGNEKVVLMTFEQAEKNLKNVLENAELCLNKYVTNDLIWDYKNDYPDIWKIVGSTQTKQKCVPLYNMAPRLGIESE